MVYSRNSEGPKPALHHHLKAVVGDQIRGASSAVIILLQPLPFTFIQTFDDAASKYSFQTIQAPPKGDGPNRILCHCRRRLHHSFIYCSYADSSQLAFRIIYGISAKNLSISSAPPTASALGALNSCSDGLRVDLLCSQRFLCLFQGLYSERRGYSGGTSIFNQHGAGLFWISFELCLHLTRCFTSHIPTFSCINRNDVYHP